MTTKNLCRLWNLINDYICEAEMDSNADTTQLVYMMKTSNDIFHSIIKDKGFMPIEDDAERELYA